MLTLLFSSLPSSLFSLLSPLPSSLSSSLSSFLSPFPLSSFFQAQLDAAAEKENHKADTRCAVLEAVRESAILGTADEVNRLYSE